MAIITSGRGALFFTQNPAGSNVDKPPYLRTASLTTNPFTLSGTVQLQNFFRLDTPNQTWIRFEISANEPSLVQGSFNAFSTTGFGCCGGIWQVLEGGYGAFEFIPDKGIAWYNGTDAFYVEMIGARVGS